MYERMLNKEIKPIMKKSLILIVFIIIILITLGGLFYIGVVNIKSEKGNDLYIKMSEINDNQSLIGLSIEEVIELLGEPRYQYTDSKNKKQFTYSAGEVVTEPFWGNNTYKYYQIEISFDVNDKVEHTYIRLSP